MASISCNIHSVKALLNSLCPNKSQCLSLTEKGKRLEDINAKESSKDRQHGNLTITSANTSCSQDSYINSKLVSGNAPWYEWYILYQAFTYLSQSSPPSYEMSQVSFPSLSSSGGRGVSKIGLTSLEIAWLMKSRSRTQLYLHLSSLLSTMCYAKL